MGKGSISRKPWLVLLPHHSQLMEFLSWMAVSSVHLWKHWGWFPVHCRPAVLEVSVTCFSHFCPTQLLPASSQRAPGIGNSQAHMDSTRSQGPAWNRKVLPSTSIQSGTCNLWDILQLCFPSRSYRVHLAELGPVTLSFWLHTPWTAMSPLPGSVRILLPLLSGRNCSSIGSTWASGFLFN